jgi:flagellar hook-associated protein 1 FlgK
MTANAGLTTSLRSLVSALETNQSTLSYISDNIANVNTKGYTRRVVAQETQVSAGSNAGVNVSEIRRSIDGFLLRSVQGQISKTAQSDVINSYKARLQDFSFGNPNSPYTINNSLNEFYSRLQSFSNEASSGVKKNLVVNSARDFTNTVKGLAESVQNERFNADSEISATIDSLNQTINTLFDINKAIGQSIAVGGDVNTLYDARDLQLSKLKEIIDVDFAYDDSGKVSASLSSTEILGFSQKYEVSYNRVSSVESLINKGVINGIEIYGIDSAGQKTGTPETLLSASDATVKKDNITDGKLRALVDLRDAEFPKILDQLDVFVYTYANEFNELHNSGSGYPPATTLNGVNLVEYDQSRDYTGKARLSLIDNTGKPIVSKFGEGLPPLTLDFSKINGEGGFGALSTRDIITEINSYYGSQPSTSVNIGSANDIRLGSVSGAINTVKASGSIALGANPSNTENIVINGTTITFVTGTPSGNQVKIGGNLSSTLENLNQFLNNSSDVNIIQASYEIFGSTILIENKTGGSSGNGFALDVSGTALATRSAATLTGGADATGNFEFDFDFSNLSSEGKDITFDVTQISINGAPASAATFNTYTQAAGDRLRTNRNAATGDTLTTSLNGLNLEEGDTFTITATINVVENGFTKTENVTFTVTVPDPDSNILNTRYPASAIGSGGDGSILTASSTSAYANAKYVDENGVEIKDFTQKGYLKIETADSSYRLSFNQLDSNEGGVSGVKAAATATNKGISSYFGLNNFFDFGGLQSGSAINFKVRDDIISNPSLLSSGKAKQSVSTGAGNVYTYELGSGSNESVLSILQLQDTNLTFASAGGLPELVTTADFFASEIYSFSAAEANTAKANYDKEQLLAESLKTRFDEVSGVNLDEELANTIQIQNSYSAAAKVLSIVRELFTKIEEAIS